MVRRGQSRSTEMGIPTVAANRIAAAIATVTRAVAERAECVTSGIPYDAAGVEIIVVT